MNHTKKIHALLWVWLGVLIPGAWAKEVASKVYERPQLIVFIAIDQFRSDYLTRFEGRFLPPMATNGDVGGFRYLMTKGAYYPFAEYSVMQSVTAVGHATVLTGAYPYQAGITGTSWFDFSLGKKVYCVESPGTDYGLSPFHLRGTTLGDEIKNSGFSSKVISMSLKDRAAILMGGHRADLAFWFDSKNARWQSSRYYLPDGKLPVWLDKINEEIQQRKDEKYVWNVSGQSSGFSDDTVYSFLQPVPGLKPGFPHETTRGNPLAFAMPLGLDLLEDAAERAIEAYRLGQGNSPDVFAISFSNHDYLGHAFGPNSREMEEMTVAEDRVFSKFFNFLRKKIPGGLKNVVFVLTADHGAPQIPEWLKSHRVPAGRIQEEDLMKKVNLFLESRYGSAGIGKSWVPFVFDFHLFLNEPLVIEKKLDFAKVQKEIKEFILKDPEFSESIAFVVTAKEVEERKTPPGLMERQILLTYFKGRSGHILVIPRPYYITGEKDSIVHISGYTYDRMVPLIFLNPKYFKPGVYAQRAEVVDIAPTLSFITRTTPPSLSEGRVLHEAIQAP